MKAPPPSHIGDDSGYRAASHQRRSSTNVIHVFQDALIQVHSESFDVFNDGKLISMESLSLCSPVDDFTAADQKHRVMQFMTNKCFLNKPSAQTWFGESFVIRSAG